MNTEIVFTAKEHERFWSKVNKTDGCWIWTAFKNPKGYGRFMFRGKVHGGSTLKEEQVKEIRNRLISGETSNSVAIIFGVHKTTISDIKRRKSWRHI